MWRAVLETIPEMLQGTLSTGKPQFHRMRTRFPELRNRHAVDYLADGYTVEGRISECRSRSIFWTMVASSSGSQPPTAPSCPSATTTLHGSMSRLAHPTRASTSQYSKRCTTDTRTLSRLTAFPDAPGFVGTRSQCSPSTSSISTGLLRLPDRLTSYLTIRWETWPASTSISRGSFATAWRTGLPRRQRLTCRHFGSASR